MRQGWVPPLVAAGLLAHLLGGAAGQVVYGALPHCIPRFPAALPTVLRNDEVSWPELERRIAGGEWHNIVISPGPGTPEREADVGEAPDLTWRLRVHARSLSAARLRICLRLLGLTLVHPTQPLPP